ncbi:MAG: hypothetical protein RMY64_34280 [Nostoc sp. DedQUE08]|uniref:hypothetical protein n=1 Tax=Nostoc sp. DedQUE08 TaxID=3075393 RepID=UPI002AD3DEE5|nr:hypothetical protein [Nostoc sp. DedQUE08]MDZ8070622.1 hypothetical protein [Nostoc sp. DedQUE08]
MSTEDNANQTEFSIRDRNTQIKRKKVKDANQQRTLTEIASHPNTIWIHTCLVSENQIKIAIAENGLGVADTNLT